MIRIFVDHLPQALRALERVADGCEAVEDAYVALGSDLPYAYGIEYGYDRYGRLRRKAGPAYMLTSTRDEIPDRLGPRLVKALPKGPSAVRDALEEQTEHSKGVAVSRTPERSGDLRRSIQAVFGGV